MSYVEMTVVLIGLSVIRQSVSEEHHARLISKELPGFSFKVTAPHHKCIQCVQKEDTETILSLTNCYLFLFQLIYDLLEFFSKFKGFGKFSESDKSLNHKFGSIEKPCPLLLSLQFCSYTLVSYTKVEELKNPFNLNLGKTQLIFSLFLLLNKMFNFE